MFLMNSASVMVKRGDKYHTKRFALAAAFAQVEVFWWHSERRRTFTRSCACPSERGFITLLADGLSWRETWHTSVHVFRVKVFLLHVHASC